MSLISFKLTYKIYLNGVIVFNFKNENKVILGIFKGYFSCSRYCKQVDRT